MKNMLMAAIAAILLLSGCGTVQSIIKSSFPYTTNFVIPTSSKPQVAQSVNSTAGSFDESLGNVNGNQYIQDVRIASARIIASTPNDQSMGMFKSVKVFIANGTSEEVMVASRNDVSEHIGSTLVLDIDNSRFYDKYIKGNSLKVRMEYVLRDSLKSDVNVRTSLSFSASPDHK